MHDVLCLTSISFDLLKNFDFSTDGLTDLQTDGWSDSQRRDASKLNLKLHHDEQTDGHNRNTDARTHLKKSDDLIHISPFKKLHTVESSET